MWQKFVKKHPNISMVFNGHVLNDGQGRRVSEGTMEIKSTKCYQTTKCKQMEEMVFFVF